MNMKSLTGIRMLAQIGDVLRARYQGFNKTFNGKRNVDRALGYVETISLEAYDSRYRRNGIARRIVNILPEATWRGDIEIIEDENPKVETPFEKAVEQLVQQHKLWEVFKRADKLAGIGHYAVILLGAPGELDQPLERCAFKDLSYLTPYREVDARIAEYDIDIRSKRYGKPMFYILNRPAVFATTSTNTPTVGKRVHHSRVIHVADGLLDDELFGTPRLESVWNLMDDLEKVTGGGAEAFWRRADGGTQFDIDPDVDFKDDELPAVKQQIEDMEHGLKKYITTRGLTVNRMGSDVADFSSPAAAIIMQVCATLGIPQRVFMGSEQGKLAAKQDRANWDNQVQDRQNTWAALYCARPTIQRFIDLGILPRPKDERFTVSFSSIQTMDDEQRADIAAKWASLTLVDGTSVVDANEIRERVLMLAPKKITKAAPQQFGGRFGLRSCADFLALRTAVGNGNNQYTQDNPTEKKIGRVMGDLAYKFKQGRQTDPITKGDATVFGVRHYGQWEMPEGEEDDGDYDWEVLSAKTGKEVGEYIAKINKANPDIEVIWHTGEKNWIYFEARPKKAKP